MNSPVTVMEATASPRPQVQQTPTTFVTSHLEQCVPHRHPRDDECDERGTDEDSGKHTEGHHRSCDKNGNEPTHSHGTDVAGSSDERERSSSLLQGKTGCIDHGQSVEACPAKQAR